MHVAKTKMQISFTVTRKLICIFVFAYADCWFPKVVAQISEYGMGMFVYRSYFRLLS